MSYAFSEERRLIERCVNGDRSALDDLVRRYQQRAYQFAFRLTADPEEAADLTSEAFVRAYKNIKNFRKESQFSTWLFRILTNCFLDHRKKEKLRKHESLDSLVKTEDGEVSKQIESPEQTPIDISEQGERIRLLQEAILKLPEYQRVMIVMYHVDNLSYEEMAATLDLPIGTVKSRLNRARLALRELLEPVEELFRV